MMDAFPDPANVPQAAPVDHGFITDQVRPPQNDSLAFLGQPRSAPFVGEPTTVLRGNDRVFGSPDSEVQGVLAAAMPRAADASGMGGQAVGGEEHNPMDMIQPDLSVPADEAEFIAKVQQCWPKVMGAFVSMMNDPVD